MIVTIVAAMILARSSKAAALNVTSSLIVTAADPVGNPISNTSLLEIADAAGTTRTLTMLSPGVFKADTTGLQDPIFIKADNFFSVSLTGKGTANVNGVTDEVLNGIYQAQGTNAAVQFGLPNPLLITPLQLRVESSLTNNFYRSAYADFKIKPTSISLRPSSSLANPVSARCLINRPLPAMARRSKMSPRRSRIRPWPASSPLTIVYNGHGQPGPKPHHLHHRRSPAVLTTP